MSVFWHGLSALNVIGQSSMFSDCGSPPVCCAQELETIKSKFKLHCLGNSAGGQVLNFAEYLFLVTVLLGMVTRLGTAQLGSHVHRSLAM